MRLSIKLVFLLIAGMAAAQVQADSTELCLAGQWRFALDRGDQGLGEQWFNRPLSERIKLPGSLQEQGFGDEVTVNTKWTGDIVDKSWFIDPQYEPYRQSGQVKVPFWLQPLKHYTGAAWYQRDLDIPEKWRGKRVVLRLERPHWETTVWLDGQKLGSNNSLAVAHEYELGVVSVAPGEMERPLRAPDDTRAVVLGDIAPGRHRLTIRVDNRLVVEVGVNSHSVSDHTQGNWNGLAGALKLFATEPIWFDEVQVFPQVAQRQARVKVVLGNQTGQPGSGTLVVRAMSLGSPKTHRPAAKTIPLQWTQAGGQVEFDYELGPDSLLWDEFSPQLYRLALELQGGSAQPPAPRPSPLATHSVTFGLREVGVADKQITVNERKIFLRGTLECCIFPLTGYPPTDVESWKRIMRIARGHGLNHLRFHSWCPPEAAFQAADELGFYFYVECPSWANQGASIGDGRPLDQWLYDESARMLRAYGNHPSFLLMSYGNEPAGKNQNRFLGDLIKRWKSQDRRRLYTSGAGWPMIPENDFHVTPTPRIQAWGEGLKSRLNARPPETMTDYRDFIAKTGAPVISHEIGQWCVYPNFDEIPKYKGLLKPRNFEIFRETLQRHGLGSQARAFLLASGKLQTLCYKEDIESALRTPGMAGFELLDLHDFPGQGTALVGVLDPFWDSKGYVTPEQYRRFAGETVPLARLPKRLLQNNETFMAQVEIAHFGPKPMDHVKPVWRVREASGKTVASGEFTAGIIPTGTQMRLGEVSLPLARFGQAVQLNLEIALKGTPYANDWDFWVYPAKTDATSPAGVVVVSSLDDTALATLERGGKVLLLPLPSQIKGDQLGRVRIGFSSIFWNTAWTQRQPPHTLGILCDPRHPALAGFPTESHSNWQWWELVTRAHPFMLTDTPAGFRPIVQAIDDWVTARKLGLVFEAKVGKGKLLACGIDLTTGLDQRPVARQLRQSLLDYAASERFQPQHPLEAAYLKSLLQPAGAN